MCRARGYQVRDQTLACGVGRLLCCNADGRGDGVRVSAEEQTETQGTGSTSRTSCGQRVVHQLGRRLCCSYSVWRDLRVPAVQVSWQLPTNFEQALVEVYLILTIAVCLCRSLQLGELLGEGAFGRVVKGYVLGLHGRMEPTVVAVKMLKGTDTVESYLLLVICLSPT